MAPRCGGRPPAAHSHAHSQQRRRKSAPKEREKPFVRPCTRWCQARRWRRRARRARGRRRCGGLRQPASRPRPSSLVQFARPRPASRPDLSPRLLRLRAQHFLLSNVRLIGLPCRRSVRPAHSLRLASGHARSGMWTEESIVRSATGRTKGGEISAGAQKRTPIQGQSGPAAMRL